MSNGTAAGVFKTMERVPFYLRKHGQGEWHARNKYELHTADQVIGIPSFSNDHSAKVLGKSNRVL